MEELKKKIIDYIRKNRISTTEVADILGKTGAVEGIYPIKEGIHAVGEVFFAYAHNESNWHLHEQLRNVPEKSIVFVREYECNNRALFGDLVSKYLLLYKQAEAVVVDGRLRDVHRLKANNYRIWYKGATPIGCFNKKLETPIYEVGEKEREFFNGSIMVADDSGVVIIPKDKITKELLEKLEFIEVQEDMWYYCIDTLKYDTYETVCLKKYLDEDIYKVLKEKKKFLEKWKK